MPPERRQTARGVVGEVEGDAQRHRHRHEQCQQRGEHGAEGERADAERGRVLVGEPALEGPEVLGVGLQRGNGLGDQEDRDGRDDDQHGGSGGQGQAAERAFRTEGPGPGQRAAAAQPVAVRSPGVRALTGASATRAEAPASRS